MPREKILESIILKKQDYGEADQIVTLFTREEGKIRCLVKAAKQPTSRLQPVLQPLFLSRVTLVGNSMLPKVISVQAQTVYSGILAEPEKLQAWFVVSELVTRSLPDGEANEQLFAVVCDYLNFLHASDIAVVQVAVSITQFQIKTLAALGMGIRRAAGELPDNPWFSVDRGGFFAEEPGVDAVRVSTEEYQLFLGLLEEPFELSLIASDTNGTLSKLISRFVTYQLEREIKSHKFLGT